MQRPVDCAQIVQLERCHGQTLRRCGRQNLRFEIFKPFRSCKSTFLITEKRGLTMIQHQFHPNQLNSRIACQEADAATTGVLQTKVERCLWRCRIEFLSGAPLFRTNSQVPHPPCQRHPKTWKFVRFLRYFDVFYPNLTVKMLKYDFIIFDFEFF